MAKYLIIFGAGASYGSDPKCKNHMLPPLGNDLFDALVAYNPTGWGQLGMELGDIFRNDFEGGMEQLLLKYPHIAGPLQVVMAQFFFRFEPTPTNLYRRIAKRIFQTNESGVYALATLNYERLLQLSFGAESRYLNEIPKVECCFPHGVCNLFQSSARISGSASYNPNMVQFGIGSRPFFIDNSAKFYEWTNNNMAPPIMSYFVPTKTTTSVPDFIDMQRLRFKELAAEVEVIAVIGVHIRPSDRHIWNSLSQSPAKIIYCSGPSEENNYKRWASDFPLRKDDLLISKFFSDGLDEIYNCIGLTA
jgi:hypothetical protein